MLFFNGREHHLLEFHYLHFSTTNNHRGANGRIALESPTNPRLLMATLVTQWGFWNDFHLYPLDAVENR